MDPSLEPAATLSVVQKNLARIRERIAAAAARAGRDPSSIELVAVTKYGDEAFVRALLDLGHRDLGENRADRILELEAALPGRARWHMIGHLQRNKARKLAPAIAAIHSIDAVETARILDKRRGELKLAPLDVWLEVNIANEAQKSGIASDALPQLAREVAALEHLRLRGLMAMPPAPGGPGGGDGPPECWDPEASRPHFRRLKELLAVASAAAIAVTGRPLDGLSMGMTHDLEVAVEEGATVVRVGRALLAGLARSA